jgi:hypothetical protein
MIYEHWPGARTAGVFRIETDFSPVPTLSAFFPERVGNDPQFSRAPSFPRSLRKGWETTLNRCAIPTDHDAHGRAGLVTQLRYSSDRPFVVPHPFAEGGRKDGARRPGHGLSHFGDPV